MISLTLGPKQATLAAVRERFHLAPEEIQEAFGVVFDPADGKHLVLVSDAGAQKIQRLDPAATLFSNPQIQPFGPPQN